MGLRIGNMNSGACNMAERTCNLNMRTLSPGQDIFVYGSVNESLLKAGSCIIFLKIIQGGMQPMNVQKNR